MIAIPSTLPFGKEGADLSELFGIDPKTECHIPEILIRCQHYALSFKEMALLEMMILHKNMVLERKMVLEKIWGEESYYNTRSLDVFMTHLRKLLKDEPDIQIMNVRGIGYKFIC